MLSDSRLYIDWVDVEASCDDDVLRSPFNEKKTLIIDKAKVTSTKPSIN